jgi:hypothetical protein
VVRERGVKRMTAATLVEAFGEKKTVAQWVADPRCAVKEQALRNRLNEGMPPEQAITMPRRLARRRAPVASKKEKVRGPRILVVGDPRDIADLKPNS